MAKEADAEVRRARKKERRLEKLEKAIVKLIAKRLKGDEIVTVFLPNVELVIGGKGGRRVHRDQNSELPPDMEDEEADGHG